MKKSAKQKIEPSKKISERFLFDWLRLALTKNVGPRTFSTLMQIFNGDPTKSLANLSTIAKNNPNKFVPCPEKEVEIFLNNIKKFQATLILSCDKNYPQLLQQIEDKPPFLIAKGRIELLSSPQIAIVGARDSSTNGNIIANRLAQDLCESGINIISGLAKGIDAAAHSGALKKSDLNNEVGTIGVVANGIDYIYPRENAQLYHKMYEEGLVISEKPIGTLPTADAFPQRNRIISGMSLGVVVVEASKKSGTLITANYAAEQGREVFAVPGSPLDTRHHGTNNLIQNGAFLVQNSEDILKNLYFIKEKNSISHFIEDSAKKQKEYTFCVNQQKDGAEMNDDNFNHELKFDEFEDENQYSQPIIIQKNLEETYSNYNNNPQQRRILREKIMAKLSFEPVHFNEISGEIKEFSNEIINIVLMEMELNGEIERKYGNMICIIAS